MKARKIIESAIIIVGSTNMAIYTITSILHMALLSVLSQHIETVVNNNLNDWQLSQELSLFLRRLLPLNQSVKLSKGWVITMLLITMKQLGKHIKKLWSSTYRII